MSTDLTRSRERYDIAACNFISRFEGNFASARTSPTPPTPHGSRPNLLSPPFATGFSPSRNSLPGCNTHSCGNAVPSGLVQHVFSPPARIGSLRSTALQRPRRRAKNALFYAVHRITLRSEPPGRSAPPRAATISRSSSTIRASPLRSTPTSSTTKAARPSPSSGRVVASRTATEPDWHKPRPEPPGGAFSPAGPWRNCSPFSLACS